VSRGTIQSLIFFVIFRLRSDKRLEKKYHKIFYNAKDIRIQD